MTEFSTIESKTLCTEANFRDLVEQYRMVLTSLSYINQAVESWLDQLRWKLTEEGYGYFNDPGFQLDIDGIQARPLIGIDPSNSGQSWFSADILFRSNDICDLNVANNDYQYKAQATLLKVAQALFKQFPSRGVYLTNEASDGKTLYALTNNDVNSENLWRFDLGIIPIELENVFSDMPDTYHKKPSGDSITFSRIACWKDNNS